MRLEPIGCALLCLFILFGSAEAVAEGAGGSQCTRDYAAGQRLRMQAKLIEAAVKFQACATERCGAVLRAQCELSLRTVESATPSVSFRVQSEAGEPLRDVRLAVDGGKSKAINGSAQRLNPGTHELVFERAGSQPSLQTIVLTEGMKLGRRVVLAPADCTVAPVLPLSQWAADGKSSNQASHSERLSQAARRTYEAENKWALAGISAPLEPRKQRIVVESSRPQSTQSTSATLSAEAGSSEFLRSRAVLVGSSAVTVLGVVGFSYFGLKARADDRRLDGCAPSCEASSVDAVKREYFLANTSLSVGVAGALATGFLFIIQSSDSDETSARRTGKSSPWTLRVGSVTTVSTRF